MLFEFKEFLKEGITVDTLRYGVLIGVESSSRNESCDESDLDIS